MQVVNELIQQLRSKGLLSGGILHELQRLGFDDRYRASFGDGEQDVDDYDAPGSEDVWWEDDIETLEAIWAEEDAAKAVEDIEFTLTERQTAKRQSSGGVGAAHGSRDERLVAAIEVHEWPQPLLDLLDDVVGNLAATLPEDHPESVLGADDETLDLAVRSTALAYPGALTKTWTAVAIDPLPGILQQGAGPEAGLFEVLVEADQDVATAIRYKSILSHGAVRRAIRVARAQRRLLASFGRLLVTMPDGEVGWHLQFNTDPLLLEVAIILYSARQPRLTVGDLLESGSVPLPSPTLLPDDPFVHGWQFAAMADPRRVLPLMQWCYERWDDQERTVPVPHCSQRVVVRIEPLLSMPATESRLRTLWHRDLEAWWDAQGSQKPRLLALVWTGTRWSRLTIGERGSADAAQPVELWVDDAVWELTELADGPPLTKPTDPSDLRYRVERAGPLTYLRIKPGRPVPGPVERGELGTQLGRGLHDLPVLRCAPEWSPAETGTWTPRNGEQ